MECIADVKAVLGEGPVWDAREQAVYWVDIPEKRVFRWSAAEGARTIAVDRHICSLLPRAAGGFIGGGYDGFLDIAPDLSTTVIANPEPDLPGNRFNDGKVDRAGRFWAGTMDRHEQAASGSLYRLDPDRSWTRIDSGYRVTNGPAFSRDGRTMYHTDSARQIVYAFDLGEDGSATNRPRPPPVRGGRRLSRRDDRGRGGLPLDRLLGRLVRAPLLAGGRAPGRTARPRPAADQLRLRGRRFRPALHHHRQPRPHA
jgi:sugar lactone lactonase YvrE